MSCNIYSKKSESLYNKNFKKLKKTPEMERPPIFMNLKDQYCEKDNSTKQCIGSTESPQNANAIICKKWGII